MFPLEIIYRIALAATIPTVGSLFLTCKDWRELLDNQEFWYHRYQQDYTPAARGKQSLCEVIEFSPTADWRELYRQFGLTWICGNDRPLTLVEGVRARHVSLGYRQIGLVSTTGEVWVDANNDNFKRNPQVQDPPLLQRQAGLTANSLAVGTFHVVILGDDSTVRIYGCNNHGQLGLGATGMRLTPTIIPGVSAQYVMANITNTIIISTTGEVWSCGWNNFGQLGVPPKNVAQTMDEPPPLLPPSALPPTTAVVRIHPPECTCLASYPSSHQDDEENDDKEINTDDCISVKEIDGSDDSDNDGSDNGSDEEDHHHHHDSDEEDMAYDDDNRNLLTLVPDITATQVAMGDHHTVILSTTGEVWTCGWNVHGQLGLGDDVARRTPTLVPGVWATQVAAGANHTVVLTMNHEVWTCGGNSSGQLGLQNTDYYDIPRLTFCVSDAKQVAAGSVHTVILTMTGEVLVCGNNKHRQLTFSDNIHRDIPTPIPNITARRIAAGGYQTAIIQ